MFYSNNLLKELAAGGVVAPATTQLWLGKQNAHQELPAVSASTDCPLLRTAGQEAGPVSSCRAPAALGDRASR